MITRQADGTAVIVVAPASRHRLAPVLWGLGVLAYVAGAGWAAAGSEQRAGAIAVGSVALPFVALGWLLIVNRLVTRGQRREHRVEIGPAGFRDVVGDAELSEPWSGLAQVAVLVDGDETVLRLRRHDGTEDEYGYRLDDAERSLVLGSVRRFAGSAYTGAVDGTDGERWFGPQSY